jgi:outer membrane protein TolC
MSSALQRAALPPVLRAPVSALALVLAIPLAASGQTPRETILAANPDSALTATIADLPGERLLLEDAVLRAADQATETRVAEAELDAATNAVRREKGAFDPELFGTGDWSGSDTPTANLFAGADVLETETADFMAGARMRLKLGTELIASVNSQRTSTNSDFASLNPEYQAYGALTLRQPLLKGFGPSARSDLSVAESNLAGAGALYDGAVLAVRAEVETVYWELYAAERNHSVTKLIRDRAAAFYEDAKLRAKAGMIGPSAVANAEFFLTEAEQAMLDTEEQMDRFSDRLASLMGRRPADVRYRSWGEPPREFRLVDQDSLVTAAKRYNTDLDALRAVADSWRALEKGSVWDARPTLDILGSIGGNGLSGTAQDVYFPGSPDPVRTDIDGNRGDSISQSFSRDYPTWNVGFVFAVPIGNREGKGERDRLRAQIVRAEQDLLAGQRQLEEEVRAQHRELRRGSRRLEIATRGVAASIRQVEIGMLEYQNGRTTAFEGVRLAADLATAQQRYSDALVRTASAAAVLRQLTGGWYPGNGNQGEPK